MKIKISKFPKKIFDPKGGPFGSKKKWIFLKKNLSSKILQNDLKRYFKAKKVKFFFEILEVFKSSIEPPSGFEIMKFC